MKTLSTALSHSAAPPANEVAVTNIRYAAQAVPHPDPTLRVRSGAQAAMLATLGSLGTVLTFVYVLTDHSPLVLLVVAPMWSLFLLSFIDWFRGDELAPRASSAHAPAQRVGYVRSNRVAPISSRYWQPTRARTTDQS